jgi:ABC-type phosphate transport system substrate-binding protein
MMLKTRNTVVVAVFATAALALSACAAEGEGTSSAGSEETAASMTEGTLRVAMGSPGEAQIAVWDEVAAAYEAANPGMTVQTCSPDATPPMFTLNGLALVCVSAMTVDMQQMFLNTSMVACSQVSGLTQHSPQVRLMASTSWCPTKLM